MAAGRNSILALGLLLLAVAAGKSALGASLLGGSSACDANCKASYEAPANSAGNSDGIAGPVAVGDPGGNAGSTTAGQPGGDLAPAAGGKTERVEDDPLFGTYTPYIEDLCHTCDGFCWKVDTSLLYIHRSSPGTRPVLSDTTTGGRLFGANNLDFDFEPGPRVSLTGLDCDGWGFELNYFGIDAWSSSTDLPTGKLPGGSANLMVDSVTQVPLSDAHFQSIARLYSTESNFRRPFCGNFSVLAGFRWLEMTDQYLATGTSTTGYAVAEQVLTHNHLYGFQLGADGPICQEADRWRLTGFVKSGIFFNSADQATLLTDPDPAGPGSYSLNTTHINAAFFGETGLVGYVQISKHLSASGGYQVMFINGVAQPVNQLSDTDLAKNTAKVDARSGLFYQGATAGLQVTW